MTTAGDNRLRMPHTLRLDPWTPTYESALQLEDDEPDNVDAFVETNDWQVIRPLASETPESIFFIDGVRRVDTGIVDEANDSLAYGLLGSYAAGVTVHRHGKAEIHREEVQRRIVIGADRRHETMLIPAGSLTLNYVGAGVKENTRAKVLAQLQVLMRKLEGDLARECAGLAALTFVDGPLTYLLPLEEAILGYVKTHSKNYLNAEQMRTLSALETGTRTPIFQFGTEGSSRYSWYMRVGPRGRLDYSLAGVVRIEVSAMIGKDDAMLLANCSTAILPRFATTPAWDPRAPQNLYPISALESRLHHHLGDRDWIRHSIAEHFHRLAEAA